MMIARSIDKNWLMRPAGRWKPSGGAHNSRCCYRIGDVDSSPNARSPEREPLAPAAPPNLDPLEIGTHFLAKGPMGSYRTSPLGPGDAGLLDQIVEKRAVALVAARPRSGVQAGNLGFIELTIRCRELMIAI
jgi:hypothetical protein